MSELKKINIRGINIANSDIDVPDGSCQEIINMRYKDGSWRPAGDVDNDWILENTSLILHKHPVLADNIFICYDSSTDKIQKVKVDDTPHTYSDIITLDGVETFKYITHQNNFLFIVTDENIYKFIYDTTYSPNIPGTDYRLLPEIPMPEMYFDVERDSNFYAGTIGGDFDDLIGILYSKIGERREKGFFEGQVLFRVAYRLFDGTFIKHSLPSYLKIDYNTLIKYQQLVPSSITVNGYFYDIVMGKPIFNYLFRTTEMIDDLKKYEGIIQSLCLFMTKPMTSYDFEDYDKLLCFDAFLGKSMIGSNSELKELFEQSAYYLVHEVKLEELTEMIAETVVLETIEDIDTEVIVSNELLAIDNFTHNNIWGNSIYNFNSRLHFGDTTTKLFDGYNNTYNHSTLPPFTFGEHYIVTNCNYRMSGVSALLYFEVYIKTSEGEKIVIVDIDAGDYWVYPSSTGTTQIAFNFIMAYPDVRAYKIKIIINYGAGIYNLLDEIELIPHKYLNLAYYVSYNSGYYDNEYKLTKFDYGSPGTLPTITFATVSKYIYDHNRIQLSDIDNPFLYPAKNSYRIDNDDNVIRIMSSITRVISEGQYGVFPLYVFTSKGIWLMEQGEGEIVYKTKNPLSREVVHNSASYVQVEGGIIFVATDSVMFISGTTIKSISDIIEGIPASYLVGYSAYDDKINDSDLVDLSTIISTIDFRTYLASAIFCYNAYEKELIVSNASKTYSYIYAFETGVWSKIDKIYSQRPDTVTNIQILNASEIFGKVTLPPVVNINEVE